MNSRQSGVGMSPATGMGMTDPLSEQKPVRQACQGIVQRVVQQSGLDGLAVGDVLDMRDQVISGRPVESGTCAVFTQTQRAVPSRRRNRHSWRETCEAPLLSSSAARRAAGRSSGWVRPDSAVPTSAAGSRSSTAPSARLHRTTTPQEANTAIPTGALSNALPSTWSRQAARVPLRPGFRARRRTAGRPVRLDHRGRGHQVAAQCPVPAAMVGVRGGKLHVGDIVGASVRETGNRDGHDIVPGRGVRPTRSAHGSSSLDRRHHSIG